MKGMQKVTDLILAEGTNKTLGTISEKGELHTITVGSMTPVDDSIIAVAEIMFQTTAKNLRENGKAAFLVTKNLESYLINAVVKERQDEGELMEMLTEKLACMNLIPRAVWTFEVTDISDQSASSEAGKKLV